MKVLTGEQYITAESGLIYLDLVEGTGEQPKDGQQVSSIFNSLFNFAHPFCAYHIASRGNVLLTCVYILRFLFLWMQVKFHYIGYNENGRRVDSSYQQGQPARTRLGVKGMIPGTFLLLNFQFNCLSSSRDLLPRHQIVHSYIYMNRDRDASANEPDL